MPKPRIISQPIDVNNPLNIARKRDDALQSAYDATAQEWLTAIQGYEDTFSTYDWMNRYFDTNWFQSSLFSVQALSSIAQALLVKVDNGAAPNQLWVQISRGDTTLLSE